jgi:hypothetical protein
VDKPEAPEEGDAPREAAEPVRPVATRAPEEAGDATEPTPAEGETPISSSAVVGAPQAPPAAKAASGPSGGAARCSTASVIWSPSPSRRR